MKIYIVRHGENNGNLRGVLQGWTDEPLNEKGRELAVITAQALSDIKFDVAISSPLSSALVNIFWTRISKNYSVTS